MFVQKWMKERRSRCRSLVWAHGKQTRLDSEIKTTSYDLRYKSSNSTTNSLVRFSCWKVLPRAQIQKNFHINYRIQQHVRRHSNFLYHFVFFYLFVCLYVCIFVLFPFTCHKDNDDDDEINIFILDNYHNLFHLFELNPFSHFPCIQVSIEASVRSVQVQTFVCLCSCRNLFIFHVTFVLFTARDVLFLWLANRYRELEWW